MAGCAAEQHARKVGLGETGDTASAGGGRTQSVGNFLQGSGAANSIVSIGDVLPFGVNSKDGRGYIHRVPATDQGEVSEAVRRRDMGDAGGRKRTVISGNAVNEDLQRDTSGNRGAVGGATSLI